MNLFATILTAFLFLAPSVSSAAQPTSTPPNQEKGSRVYVASGNVYVRQGSSPAHRVINSESITSGAMISTGKNSSALIKFEDGGTVTMQADSVFLVRNYSYDAAKVSSSNIVFSMLKGGMRFITGLIGQQNRQAFRLRTPNATIGIRGTDFMVTMVNDKMYSKVLNGGIDMTNSGGVAVLKTGQSALASSPRALASVISDAAVPSGIFNELLSIPIEPSAIPTTSTAPPPKTAPAASAQAPVSVPSAGIASGAVTGAVAAGTSIGAAGSILGSTESSKKAKPSTPKPPPPVKPVAVVKKPAEPETAPASKSGYGLTAKVGTLGLGGEFNMGISDSLSARFGINTFNRKYDAKASDMNFKFDLNLQTASALADWYPFQGSFRTSGGLFYNNNKFSLTAIPNGSFIINGTPYSTTQVASVKVDLGFNKVAPYFGIGWGNPVAKGKGWGLVSDFGVLFQGKPILDLTVTCTTTCPGTLAADATAENAKLQNDLKNFQWWPVASIGITYQW